jgi:hypothetical protein
MIKQNIAEIQGLTRTEKFLIWMLRNNIKIKELAKKIGVCENSVRCHFAAERIPSWRYQQYIAAGVPAFLLPEPRNISPGPKPTA